MSITAETCKEHAKDPAVLCCRAEAGITIGPENLEDPAIFDDLVDSGLLKLDGCLTIEEILGATLTKTCDSLTPITADVVDGAKVVAAPAAEEVVEEAAPVVATPAATTTVAGGTLKIHIGEGKTLISNYQWVLVQAQLRLLKCQQKLQQKLQQLRQQ